jgi:hypothetical protein
LQGDLLKGRQESERNVTILYGIDNVICSLLPQITLNPLSQINQLVLEGVHVLGMFQADIEESG